MLAAVPDGYEAGWLWLVALVTELSAHVTDAELDACVAAANREMGRES
jgi:hypothetical protein